MRYQEQDPPTETEQKVINRTTIPAQVTRSLRPRDADMSEQAWEQPAREQLPMTTNDYMAPLQHNITGQFPARYVLREGETWEANARYARNVRSLKPLLKAALQRARYCMAVDSTCRSDLPIDNLMPDVLVLTMPLSRFAEVAEMVGAIYDPNLRGSQKEPPPQRVIFANLLDHMACEGLLHDLDAIMSDVRQLGNIAALVNEVVGAMERAAGILRGRLGALALFVSPPGFVYWPRSLQQFVYILLEVCKARRVEFAICAPNLRVDREDLRPDTLSYPAFFAAVSRALVALERSGNAQLTIDDAILYDYGMRMGRLAFDLDGDRIARESNVTEREAVRRYNWLVRKDKEIPVRAELAELTKQIGAWPAARTVERTIPQIHFASGIEPVKLPVGLRCIVAMEATNLKAEVDAAATTYAYWYQTRFATRTLAEVARELNCPLEAFCTSLGLGWNLEVLTSDPYANGQAARNNWRGNCRRNTSARASDGSDQVCSRTTGLVGRHSDCLRPHRVLQLLGPGTRTTTQPDPLGTLDDFQRPARLFRPTGAHACVNPTLAIFHPGVRLRSIRGRGPIPTTT